MQNSSGFWTSSAKSTADQTQAFSLPVCSCSFVPGITAAHSTELTEGEAVVENHIRLRLQSNARGMLCACAAIADILIHGGGDRHAGIFQHTKHLI